MINIKSSVLNGYTATNVSVECILSKNLPNITIVGMANKAVEESRERVRGAITNSSLEVPKKRIIINLAPAEIPKTGSSLDLPIAVAILLASKQISSKLIHDTSFIGELSLKGELRSVSGVLGHIKVARDTGLKRIVIPHSSLPQASLIEGIDIIPVKNLRELYSFLHEETTICTQSEATIEPCSDSKFIRLEEIKGQESAKRALTIAVAGRHNLLFSGPPGTGKTLLANAAAGLMPNLSGEETATLTHLYSLATGTQQIINCRPFRAPHHTASHISLIGGGTNPKPGEISLAHNGILFLDELLEFSRHTIETLRQPLESGVINISRAATVATYPARFMLIGALNPCPCGFLGDDRHECVCSNSVVYSYQRKLSGPMLDRFDIQLSLDRLNFTSISYNYPTTAEIKKYISRSWKLQLSRNRGVFNSQLQLKELEKTILSDAPTREFYLKTAEKLALSTRAFVRILRVARSIADLDQKITVEKTHILEALSYRKTPQTIR